jgi:phage tail-like protein
MADTNNDGLWPVAKFYFLVTIAGTDISFQEVSGLDVETDVMDYRHGDSKTFGTIKKPGLIKTTNLTLKKGVFAGDSRLVDYFNALMVDKSYYATDRMQIDIKLMDEADTVIMTWTLVNAFPTKLSGTDLKSDSSEIAIETLELAHEGMTIKVG